MVGKPRTARLGSFALDGFWSDAEWSTENYTEPPPTNSQRAAVEAALGYRLPDAYSELVTLTGSRNGGVLERCAYRIHFKGESRIVSLAGIFAIGSTAPYSLLGEFGGTFMVQEWGYPELGVYFADTPSAGHEMFALDYRACGPLGEPTVVHVDQENNYRVTVIAPDFATFVRGLITEDEAYASENKARLEEALTAVSRGTLSPLLSRAVNAVASELPDGETALRDIARRLVREKGSFALHADDLSWQMYDATFWLYSRLTTATSFANYFEMAPDQSTYERPCHVLMLRIALPGEPYGFCTRGYAEGFVLAWWDAKVADGSIARLASGWRFTPAYEARVLTALLAGPAA